MPKDFMEREFEEEFNNGQPWGIEDAERLYNEIRQEVLTATGQRMEWYLRVMRKLNRYVIMHRNMAVKEDRLAWNAQQELLDTLGAEAVAMPALPASRFVQ